MIRVASLKDMVNAGYKKTDIAGMTPKQQLELIDTATHKLVVKQYDIYATLYKELNENKYILPGIGDAGDRIFGTK